MDDSLQKRLKDTEDGLKKHNSILLNLAKGTSIDYGDLNSAIREITVASTQALKCDRSSVWIYNENKTSMTCLNLFVNSRNEHTGGSKFSVNKFPNYFKSLEEERILSVTDANTDPNTSELSESYLRANKIVSLLYSPIRIDGEIIGVLCNDQTGERREWTMVEENFASSLSELVSRAIEAQKRKEAEEELKRINENLEKIVEQRTVQVQRANIELKATNEKTKKALEMAKMVQNALIPQLSSFEHIKEISLAGDYTPMDELGGDIYDIIRVERNRYGFLIADVSGHGVPAALISTMAKVSFTTNTKINLQPHEICERVNREMYHFIGDMEYFVTAYYSILNLETGEFRYCNAGHHPALLFRKEDSKIIDLHTEKSFLIGAADRVDYDSGSVYLKPGDKILFITDGIVHAMNLAGEMYEYDRLKGYLADNHEMEVNQFVEGLVKDLNKFCSGMLQNDDRTILYLAYNSKA
ncbi:MAG: SpoIIE family protein phosphatase [Leptospira sp.]|nr:SpoIIE family protein phosphatase [Leptospira sp.]